MTPEQQGQPSREALAALAGVAQAVSDPEGRRRLMEDPASVDGFQDLPPGVRDTLTGLSAEELAALGKASRVLIDNGFYVTTDKGPMQMF